MIDVSDGFALDLDRLAVASGVGVRLDEVPVALGATLDEALGGGEDYELVFTAPELGAPSTTPLTGKASSGRLTDRRGCRRSRLTRARGQPFEPTGYAHRLGAHGPSSRASRWLSAREVFGTRCGGEPW